MKIKKKNLLYIYIWRVLRLPIACALRVNHLYYNIIMKILCQYEKLMLRVEQSNSGER